MARKYPGSASYRKMVAERESAAKSKKANKPKDKAGD